MSMQLKGKMKLEKYGKKIMENLVQESGPLLLGYGYYKTLYPDKWIFPEI